MSRLMYLKIALFLANSADPDEIPFHDAVFHLDPHCFLKY